MKYVLHCSEDCGIQYHVHESGDDLEILRKIGNDLDNKGLRWVIIDNEAPPGEEIIGACRIFIDTYIGLDSHKDKPVMLLTSDRYIQSFINRCNEIIKRSMAEITETVNDVLNDNIVGDKEEEDEDKSKRFRYPPGYEVPNYPPCSCCGGQQIPDSRSLGIMNPMCPRCDMYKR